VWQGWRKVDYNKSVYTREQGIQYVSGARLAAAAARFEKCDRASTSSEESKDGADNHEGGDTGRNPNDAGDDGSPAVATNPHVGVVAG
jgi:hypothetical protein